MNALEQARFDLANQFRYGDDEHRPIIDELKAVYDYEPKPGDPSSPYLSVWQNGATADNQFFTFQLRLYVEMVVSPKDGQREFDGICLGVDRAFAESSEFVTTGWQTEWNGDLLVGMWDVLIGRFDVS